MAKIATAKQTGGGGFDFEDKVTAYFLAHLISGKYPLNPELGLIERIDFQVRPLGWLFDDLLLTMNDGTNQHRVAVSAKSNRQITGTGFPDEILTDIWTQYLNAGHQLFNPKLDYLLFVVSPIARSVSENLSNLINTVRVTTPADMLKRLVTPNFSAPLKTLFNSFKCPAPLKATYNVSDEETCNLLLRILVKEFDFQSNTSNDEVNLIGLLQECLESKQPAEAGFLFNRLAGLRKEYAPFGGYIDYPGLLSKISGQFKLSVLSEHSGDWKKIDYFTRNKLDNVPDLLGQSFSIDRSNELEQLATMLSDKGVVFLLGPSGSGKTVLALKMAEKVIGNLSKVIWFDPAMLMSGTPEQLFNIDHSLKELMEKSRSSGNLLVIDGADRLYKKEFVEVMATLMRYVAGMRAGLWNILITSQHDDYEELVKKLSRSNLPIPVSDIFNLGVIGREQVLAVGDKFPQLADLVKHEHLLNLLYNLKFLDLVIFNITKDNSTELFKDTGETQLIDWLWQQEILDKGDNGAANSRFLQILAEKQANELTLFTPTTDFQIAESVPITELKQGKIIGEIEDRLFFTHDLYGDWARYKMIRANKEKIFEYLPQKDLFSPLWCKAIRLFGIYLLEKNNNSTEWLTTYNGFNQPSPESKTIQNLLLESIIFSNDTLKYLNDLWEEFKKDDAKLLNHFFEQFFFKATLPNPVILQLAEKLRGITISQLATYHRMPKFIYWIPVMKFISGHVDEVIELSRKNAVRISKDWLEYTPPNAIFRGLAAEIAIKLAKWFIAFKEDGGFAMDQSGKDFYGPMLMAFRENQAEVKALSLQLSARVTPEKSASEKHDDHPFLRNYNPRRGTVLPDGPMFKVDDDFQEACLDTENLIPMMELNPVLVKEILLAILLSEPENVQDPSSHNFKYDIYEPHQWFPPFYSRGPFLNFLKTAPGEALSFVLTLTNFATEEWKLEQQARQEEITFITLDILGIGVREYYGDNRVYYWFRDIGNAPHSLISILMALEKFLIDLIDSGKEHERNLKQILENSNSLALIGILSSVGRYSPKLFLTVLQPLLECFDLYQLESTLDYGATNIEGHQMIGSNFMDSTTWELASKWHSMPHRKTSIRSVALPLMIGNEQINYLFKNKIIPEWTKLNQQRTDEGYIDPFLVNMIAQLCRFVYDALEKGSIRTIF